MSKLQGSQVYNSHILKRGDPVQVVVVSGPHYHFKRRLLRCVLCADGEPPPDLPELPERAP